jgi:O-antigen/teichoic acid export membrane protein
VRRRLALNIGSNYVSLGAQVLYLLAMAPYIIDRLGTEAFGAWSIVLAFLGYLRLLDLGLGQTTARFVAAAESPSDLNRVVATSLGLQLGTAALAAVVGVGVAAVAPELFGHVKGLRGALAVASISAALQLPLAVFTNVLYGVERIAERNVTIVLRVAAAVTAIVLTVELGGGLLAFVAAAAAAELAVMVVQAIYCLLRIPGLSPRPADFDRGMVRTLTGFSAAMLGIAFATQLAFYSDGIVIGAALGAAAAGVYTVAMRLVDGTSQLLAQFADVFMPAFSRLTAQGRDDEAARIVAAGTRATLIVGLPLIGLLIGLGEPLIRAWVGDGFSAAWTPLALLSGGLVFGGPIRFAVLWAIGAAKHGRIAALALLDALANVALSIALVGPLGIDGVALATLVTLAASNGLLIPLVVYGELGKPVWRDHFLPLATASLAVLPAAALVRVWVSPLVEGSIPLTAVASVAWLALTTILVAVAVLGPEGFRRLLGTRRRLAREGTGS